MSRSPSFAAGAYVVHGKNYRTGPGGRVAEPERFRRALRHDLARYEVPRREAGERGLVVAPRLGLADPHHLTNRIGSLVMDPQHHPDPGDRPVALGLRGAWASRDARLPTLRRTMLAMWFLALGVLPRPWAAKFISWRLDPLSRLSDSDARWRQSGARPFGRPEIQCRGPRGNVIE
jgi:hypothetical protein